MDPAPACRLPQVRRCQWFNFKAVDIGRQKPRISDEIAIRAEEPSADTCRLDQTTHHALGKAGDQNRDRSVILQHGAFTQCRREEFALGRQGLQLGINQTPLIAV